MSAALRAAPARGRAELRLAGQAGVVLALLAIPALAAAAALNGTGGVLGAAAGLGLVAILFVAGAGAAHVAARGRRSAMPAVLAIGVSVRLVAYLLALGALSQLDQLHRPSLAIATAIGFVVTLTFELRLISRTPELFWLEVASETSGAGARSR